jgi:hypothetical protein
MKTRFLVLAAMLTVFANACASPNQERDAVLGGVVGAGAGAIIGHQFGRGGTETGALIGGTLGAAAGLSHGQQQDAIDSANQRQVAPPPPAPPPPPPPPPPPWAPGPRVMGRPAPHPGGDDFRNPYVMPNPQFCGGQWVWDAPGRFWQCR